MKRAMLSMLALGIAAIGPAASAQDHADHAGDTPHVSVQYASYAPQHLDIVAGETVAWTNDTVRQHTVTADDGSFDSGRLFGAAGFKQRFDRIGTVAYHCSLHAGITGSVTVHGVLLDPPRDPAAAGHEYPITGRAAAAPGTQVSIEADAGDGFKPAGTAEVGSDGHFTAKVRTAASARYRAIVAGAEASPPVQVLVLDRKVGVRVLRSRGRIAVRAMVTPASSGARVVLQLRLRDRFGWWPVRSARLDHHSMARLALRYPRRVKARVVLTLDDGATVLATSPSFRVGGR